MSRNYNDGASMLIRVDHQKRTKTARDVDSEFLLYPQLINKKVLRRASDNREAHAIWLFCAVCFAVLAGLVGSYNIDVIVNGVQSSSEQFDNYAMLVACVSAEVHLLWVSTRMLLARKARRELLSRSRSVGVNIDAIRKGEKAKFSNSFSFNLLLATKVGRRFRADLLYGNVSSVSIKNRIKESQSHDTLYAKLCVPVREFLSQTVVIDEEIASIEAFVSAEDLAMFRKSDSYASVTARLQVVMQPYLERIEAIYQEYDKDVSDAQALRRSVVDARLSMTQHLLD